MLTSSHVVLIVQRSPQASRPSRSSVRRVAAISPSNRALVFRGDLLQDAAQGGVPEERPIQILNIARRSAQHVLPDLVKRLLKQNFHSRPREELLPPAIRSGAVRPGLQPSIQKKNPLNRREFLDISD
jgi:hypothetical protein